MMKATKRKIEIWIICATALCIVILASCKTTTDHSANQVSKSELMNAAEELDSLFLVAFNNGDLDAIMNLHWNSPELHAYPPVGDPHLNGYEAVKEMYKRDFNMNKGAKLEYLTVNNTPFSDVVVGHGTFRWTMPIEGGAPMVFDGRYTEVKAFKDGKMRILLDHTSAPFPPPADTTQVQ